VGSGCAYWGRGVKRFLAEDAAKGLYDAPKLTTDEMVSLESDEVEIEDIDV
jgi:hypothetical protein